VKRHQPEQARIAYHVFDMPRVDGDDELPWHQRGQHLFHTLSAFKVGFTAGEPIQYVHCHDVTTLDDIMAAERNFVSLGYEGAMYRADDGLYLWGHRSYDVLKVKSFEDHEFVVIGAREGRGAMEGHVVWVCQNDINDETFECNMACTMAQRAEYWRDRDQYIGRKLTIKHKGRTDAGIPYILTGKAFRPEEDLS
jgi:ATP-dependent DNA ligase